MLRLEVILVNGYYVVYKQYRRLTYLYHQRMARQSASLYHWCLAFCFVRFDVCYTIQGHGCLHIIGFWL